jgi:hypothetical protein
MGAGGARYTSIFINRFTLENIYPWNWGANSFVCYVFVALIVRDKYSTAANY